MLFILVLSFGSSFVSATKVNPITKTSIQTSCGDWNFTKVYYAWQGGLEMMDTFYCKESSWCSSYLYRFDAKESYVSLYNVISNALYLPELSYVSEWKPHNVYKVVVMWALWEKASITSNIPTSYKRSDIAAQVVYHVVRTRFPLSASPWKNTFSYFVE
jgi:hypothetical protein